jgi:hypothetical protein
MNRIATCRTARRLHPLHALIGLPWLLALAWPAGAQSQTSAPVAAPAASRPAPPAAAPRTTPRRLSTAELRDSATAPGELRPERPVLPQIVIPLGKGAPAPTAPPARARRDGPAPAAAAIDDRAARCEAQRSAAARARCHDQLAHEDARR